jgi:NTP pyrophosphatase (non-canonical NTP hydrolase)
MSDKRNDENTTLADLKMISRKFTYDRNWDKFHNVKNLAATAVTEAAELLDHFRFKDYHQADKYMRDPESRREVADEMADTVWAIWRMADRYGIDLATEIYRKAEKSAAKYPAEKYAKRIDERIVWLKVKEGRLLVVEEDKTISLPYTQQQNYEHHHQALLRGMSELHGVGLREDSFQLIGQFERPILGDKKYEAEFAIVYTAETEGDLDESADNSQMNWLSIDSLDWQVFAPLDRMIMRHLVDSGMGT